ncbi:MAG: winged helix-turn-helix transcriptional regulator [Gemmataceae bacterium]
MARRERPKVDNTHEPLAKLLGILASPWTLLLLHRLHIEGPKRFGELKRRLGGISTKTLTDRLRMLEAEGWLTRHYEPTVPPAGHVHHHQEGAGIGQGHDRARPDRRAVVRQKCQERLSNIR